MNLSHTKNKRKRGKKETSVKQGNTVYRHSHDAMQVIAVARKKVVRYVRPGQRRQTQEQYASLLPRLTQK